MPQTTASRASDSDSRPDDSVEGLLPPRRSWLNAALITLAVLVLLVAAFSPELFRPSMWTGAGGNTTAVFAGPTTRAVTTTDTTTGSWTPFTVGDVGDVPGARVLDAWLVTGADVEKVRRASPDTSTTVEEYLGTILDDPAAARLPQRIMSNGPAALVVVWAIDDCTALQEKPEPVVGVRNVVGVRVMAALPDFAAPQPRFFEAAETPDTDGGLTACAG